MIIRILRAWFLPNHVPLVMPWEERKRRLKALRS